MDRRDVMRHCPMPILDAISIMATEKQRAIEKFDAISAEMWQGYIDAINAYTERRMLQGIAL